MKLLFSLLLALLFSFTLLACRQTHAGEEKATFSYTISVTAPHEYPVEVYLGYLSDSEDFISAIPKTGAEFQGWAFTGASGGMRASRIPSFLELTWVSYAEKKFWKVEANLPKEKILHYFEEGFSSLGKPRTGPRVHKTYNELVIGTAPGGVVVVWLTGSGIKRVEIGRYQAKDTVVDRNKFVPVPDPNESQEGFYDRKYNIYIDSATRTLIEKGALHYGLWDDYRTKYNWKFTTQFYKPDYDERQYFTYFNGEMDVFYKEQLDQKQFALQAVPYRANLIFSTKNAEVEFREPEIRAAFAQLTKKNSAEPLELVGTIGFEYKTMTFKLKSKDGEIPLPTVFMNIYSNE